MGDSKIISKGDDGAKLLIMTLLGKNKTGGFDIDSLYCIHGKYYVFEFLKCECIYPGITPFTSHPNKYWKNKQKFISLWNVSQKLDGNLFLINYETDKDGNIGNRFRVLKVIAIDDSGITTTGLEEFSKTGTGREIGTNLDLQKMTEWFQKINNSSLKQ